MKQNKVFVKDITICERCPSSIGNDTATMLCTGVRIKCPNKVTVDK
jgi:hypothetical protein